MSPKYYQPLKIEGMWTRSQEQSSLESDRRTLSKSLESLHCNFLFNRDYHVNLMGFLWGLCRMRLGVYVLVVVVIWIHGKCPITVITLGIYGFSPGIRLSTLILHLPSTQLKAGLAASSRLSTMSKGVPGKQRPEPLRLHPTAQSPSLLLQRSCHKF